MTMVRDQPPNPTWGQSMVLTYFRRAVLKNDDISIVLTRPSVVCLLCFSASLRFFFLHRRGAEAQSSEGRANWGQARLTAHL